MLSFFREGPKFIIVESTKYEILAKKLKESSQYRAKAHRFDDAFEQTSEQHTVIFIVEKMKESITAEDMKSVLIMDSTAEEFLCQLLSDNEISALISKVRMAPGIFLLRSFGNPDKILESIEEEYKDKHQLEGSFLELMNHGNNKGVIVVLSEKPLNKELSLESIYPKGLYIEENPFEFNKGLRLNALRYMNNGLGNKDWYEYEIRIYDRYSAYKLHYEKLLMILDNLQAGLVLGESWAKDYPRLFMSVGVYRIRFFSFLSPQDIKKILLALEHTADGTRIVDYDLYYNRKKIYWSEVMRKDVPRNRKDISQAYRFEIYEKLSPEALEELKKLEEEILKTRVE